MVEESDHIQHSYEEDCLNMTECTLKQIRPLNVSTANKALYGLFSQKYLANVLFHWLIPLGTISHSGTSNHKFRQLKKFQVTLPLLRETKTT